MSKVQVADFKILDDVFELPSLGTGFQNGVVGFHDVRFHLPKDTVEGAVLFAVVDTMRGMDDGVDVQFSLLANGAKWVANYKGDVYLAMHWPIPVKPGDNSIHFQLDKGGTIKGSETLMSFGGKGKVAISQLVLAYHRAIDDGVHIQPIELPPKGIQPVPHP